MKKRTSKQRSRQAQRASRYDRIDRLLSLPATTHYIRLTTGPGAYSATAGGVASGYIAVDPTLVSYTELADEKAMYSQYRCVGAELSISPESGNTTKRSLWIAAMLHTPVGNPTSYSQIDDNAIVLKYANIASDNTSVEKTIRFSHSKRSGPLYQEWGTASTDSAGGPGGFYWYGDGFTASQPYALISLRAIFQVRDRV